MYWIQRLHTFSKSFKVRALKCKSISFFTGRSLISVAIHRSSGFYKGVLFLFLTVNQTCFELIAHTEFEILVLSRFSFLVEILIVKGPVKSGLLRIEIRSVSIRSWSA
jgi:hypothetical protein